VLKLSTPKSRRLAALAESGIIVPEKIPADNETLPLDFTRLSFRGIGEIQSRYAVRYAHVIWNVAILDADITRLRRDLRIAQSKFRIRHKDEMKNIADAMMEDDQEISDFLDRISEIEVKKTLLDAVSKSYDSIAKAASREISRRTAEIEGNLGND
jgi:hypothetical protein